MAELWLKEEVSQLEADKVQQILNSDMVPVSRKRNAMYVSSRVLD